MVVPFTFLLNAGSGKQDVESLLAILQRQVPEERQGCFYIIRPGDDFRQVMNEAIAECQREGSVLVAGGGDGTLSSVIARIMPLGIPLGVIPLGTFNYFAREQGIPLEPEAAVAALLEAEPTRLPVCLLNDEPFLVNVSLGIHTKIIEARERHTRLTGRNRLVALLSGAVTLLKEQYSLRARLTLDGRPLQRRATMVLVSNNHLQLESLALTPAVEGGAGASPGTGMAVVIMRAFSRRALLMLMWRRLLGHLETAPDVECHTAQQLDIQLVRSQAKVVIDGELRRLRTPLKLRLQEDAIICLLPKAQEVAA